MSLRDLQLENECTFAATRSGGKGGQHVNKVASRIELYFDIPASGILSETQKSILLEKLASRLTSAGVLRLTEDSSRSQHENREMVVEKFYTLLANALRPRKKRVRTKTPKAVKEKRLEKKRRRSTIKKIRRERFE